MKKQIILNDVFNAAQYVFGYTKEELFVESRKGNRPFARQLIQWYLVKKQKYTYQAAALATGRKSHLTSRHACKVVQNVLDIKDKKHLQYYNNFNKVLKLLRRSNEEAVTGQIYKICGQLTLHSDDGCVISYKDGVLTYINDNKISKTKIPGTTSIEDFISIVINLK